MPAIPPTGQDARPTAPADGATSSGTDVRLVLPALAVWGTAALTLGAAVAVIWSLAVVAVAGGAVLLVRGRRAGRLTAGTLLVCVAASAAGVGVRVTAVRSGPVRDLARHGERAVVDAVITSDPVERRRPGRVTFVVRARAEAVVVNGRRVPARAKAVAWDGRRAEARAQPVARDGRRVHPRAGPVAQDGRRERVRAGPVAWDGRRSLARAEPVAREGRRVRVRVPVLLLATDARWARTGPSVRVRLAGRFTEPRGGDLTAAVVIVRGPPTVLRGPSPPQRFAGTIRSRLRAAVARLPPDQRGILPAMVVGDVSGLDPRLAADFRTAGLTHLLVVSGANLAIVIGAVLALCRLAGLGRRVAPVLAAGAVLLFVLVARPEPSVLRATVMGMVGLVALLGGRGRQGLPALGAAVILLVLLDPSLGRSAGFALSVLATAGLLVLAPAWRDRLRRRLPAPIADAVAVAAAAEAAVAPVLVLMSGELGVLSVAANLLAAPAVAPATLLGAMAALTAPIALPIARLIVVPAGFAVGWVAFVARTTARLPHASIPWPDGLAGAASLVAAMAAGVLVIRSPRLRVAAAGIAAGLLPGVILLRLVSPGWPPPGWRMVACDVGQGDALALAAGPSRAVVIDAGPDPRAVDGCLDRLGIKDVPLLVITHPHADHIDGIPGVRAGRTTHLLLTTPRDPGRTARLTGRLATTRAMPGQIWRIGNLTLTVLAPTSADPPLLPSDDGTTINNASVVLLARSPDFSALLPGDIEEDAQHALAPAIPPVDVLKVPHHGSRSQDRTFLAAARARLALISVGRDNDYGHPAPTTMNLLRDLHVRTYRTDREGDIAIARANSGLVEVSRR
ncbi:MBL fold metallo-hydrolase [Actinomadura rayongensis]|uniref:MBL fold metallo-hydrolase n=2 Tax=Actinomadura rayongensis TaxID=1429076 RepID=A0A6I4WAF1_9ACTN|nr:MBL fold metallo-hydrolase [Actinomadura rayongensis]